MSEREPTTELDQTFSSPGATPTPWSEGRDALAAAGVYWLSTVRPDGRPHVTPLIAIWLDDAIHFCTGPTERKAKNLAANPHVVLTTGHNAIDEGLDVVVEGDAVPVTDGPTLQRLADAYADKYGWRFEVRGDAFHNDEGGRADVFRVEPATAFGFRKGDPFGQTRWRFARLAS